MIPLWLENLEEEEWEFIRKFYFIFRFFKRDGGYLRCNLSNHAFFWKRCSILKKT